MKAQPTAPATEIRTEPDQLNSVVDVDRLDTATTVVRSKALDQRWVIHLSVSAQSWPPILVTDTLQVLDGHHRVAAARRLGMDTISATILTGLSPAEALEAAISANATHGLALSRAERRHLVDRLMHAAPNWSDRRIAAAVGVSPTTVGKRRHAKAETESPTSGVHDGHPERRIGPDGKAYPVPGVQVDTFSSPDERSSLRRMWQQLLAWFRRTVRYVRHRVQRP